DIASQHNDSIRVKGLLLPSPTVGKGLGMRAILLIELRTMGLQIMERAIADTVGFSDSRYI
ncbi:MAG: hypothetical protein AAGJ55_00390, partial [Cyanobacteria bacterium J06555_12]